MSERIVVEAIDGGRLVRLRLANGDGGIFVLLREEASDLAMKLATTLTLTQEPKS